MSQRSSSSEAVMVAQAPATQTGTQPAGTQPVTVVKQHSFATFSFGVTLVLILLLFCYFFFRVRRKGHSKHVDSKAGDEGED